ncbi:MAG TPA: hypothetical protein EYP23_00765 [Thermoplasmata archaeon]|nr:hypothetical protein [Thermoplasmata archaeon]
MGGDISGIQGFIYDIFSPDEAQEEMLRRLMDLEFGSEDKVHIIDTCEKCSRNVILIGKKRKAVGILCFSLTDVVSLYK